MNEGPACGPVEEYFGRAVALRDVATDLHDQRVGVIAQTIALYAGFSPQEARCVGTRCALHDVGKLGTPDSVLRKLGPYGDQERAEMRRHCQDGFELLSGYLTQQAAVIALCHHERYDGTGYPRGIRATEIPLEARICSIADYFDAATSAHGEVPRLEKPPAVTEIVQLSGSWFDPTLVGVFVKAVAGGAIAAGG